MLYEYVITIIKIMLKNIFFTQTNLPSYQTMDYSSDSKRTEILINLNA